jgi:hypothetical protein
VPAYSFHRFSVRGKLGFYWIFTAKFRTVIPTEVQMSLPTLYCAHRAVSVHNCRSLWSLWGDRKKTFCVQDSGCCGEKSVRFEGTAYCTAWSGRWLKLTVYVLRVEESVAVGVSDSYQTARWRNLEDSNGKILRAYDCARVCACARARARVYVWVREREISSYIVRAYDCVCVCVCEREREISS